MTTLLLAGLLFMVTATARLSHRLAREQAAADLTWAEDFIAELHRT